MEFKFGGSETNQKTVLGHPSGLFVLFFTEMWERFSYYGMRALLVLFLVSTMLDGGWEWERADALKLYGWYTGLVYVTPIIGGFIADKIMGYRNAVVLGALLMTIGHASMALEGMTSLFFYAGLFFLIIGNGLFKPNISSMVGQLYKNQGKEKDAGYTIFYMGINSGAFLGILLCGYIGEKVGWHYGFGLAGIGMLIGMIVYWWGQKYLEGVGEYIGNDSNPDNKDKDRPLTRIEKDRMLVMFLSFFLIIVFWGAFEQAGGLMNLYADEKTNRMLGGFEVPASWFQSVNAFFIITLGTAVAGFWYRWKLKGREGSSLFKMAIGVIIMGWGFMFMRFASQEYDASGSSAMYWLVLAYLFHTIGELCASPVALSFITKLAPAKYASFMMGAYFAATGLGNKVAGWIGESAQNAGELKIFTGLVIFCTVVGIIVLLLLKPLKRLTHGAEDLVLENTH